MAIFAKSIGFGGAMLEDVVPDWEDAAGLGLRIPYLSPAAFRTSNWHPDYITVSPSGVVDVSGTGEITIEYWDETAAIVHTGLSALLIIWFAQAFLSLFIGGA